MIGTSLNMGWGIVIDYIAYRFAYLLNRSYDEERSLIREASDHLEMTNMGTVRGEIEGEIAALESRLMKKCDKKFEGFRSEFIEEFRKLKGKEAKDNVPESSK